MKYSNLKYAILCIFLYSIGLYAQKPISLPTLYQPQAFDVLHYDADLDLRQGLTKYVSGRCSITFVWIVNSLNENFYFHLRDLKVDSAFVGENKVTPEFHKEQNIDYSYYQINFSPVTAGDTQTVEIYYSGYMTTENFNPPFGGVFLKDSVLFAIGVGLWNEYVSTTQHWLPVYDHPSDKATYSIRFKVPPGYVIATNGRTLEVPTPDTLTETVWATSSKFPIATYLLTFAMGKFKTTNVASRYLPKSIEFVVYYLPQYEDAAIHSFKNFHHTFFAFQNRFGRYPFEKIGFVLVPFSAGAMEHQTMITMPQVAILNLFQSQDTVNLLAAHEFAHQWFGDMATPLDFRDAWLSESFATFSESVFLEMLFGYDKYLARQLEKKNDYFNKIVPYEGVLPLYNFRRTPPSSNYPGTIYNKGAVVVGMLRYLLGDDKFFELLRTYLDSSAYKSKSTQDFESFCNNYLGENISWFFKQWVYGKGYPIVEATVSKFPRGPDSADVLVKVKQVQNEDLGRYMNLPLELNFKTGTKQYFETVLVMRDVEQEFLLEGIPEFSELKINRGAKVVSLLQYSVYLDVTELKSDTPMGKIFQVLYSNRNVVTLKFNIQHQNYRFRIFDVLGRVVTEGEINVGKEIETINFPELNKGLYLIQLTNGGIMQTEKVVVK
jgi:aminopeptidase N